MPKLGNASQMLTNNTGHFGFSHVEMDTLDSSQYTLVDIECDRSGSTDGFQADMEAVLKAVIAACEDKKNPYRDNLLARVSAFDHEIKEVHGFDHVTSINPDIYDGCLAPRGSTALIDATINGIEALVKFGKDLIKKDYTVNGILVVITDGEENCSTLAVPGPGGLPDPKNVKAAFGRVMHEECMESMLSILVGVNCKSCKAYLDRYHKEAGFTQFVPLEDASKETLMKLAKFISKSISSQSSHLGSKGPSQPVTF